MGNKEVLNLSHERFKELEDRLMLIDSSSCKVETFLPRNIRRALNRRVLRYARKHDADAMVIGPGSWQKGPGIMFEGFLGNLFGAYAQTEMNFYKFKEDQSPN